MPEDSVDDLEYANPYPLESWVDISSQPSSSSLSSAADEVDHAALRVPQDSRGRRRRSFRLSRPTTLSISHRQVSVGGTSSQEEYEESESESDRVLTSSGEGPFSPPLLNQPNISSAQRSAPLDEVLAEDDARTAINYPISNDQCFTPQPNAFSHPPSGQLRHSSQPVPGSYFPVQRRPSYRHSLPASQHNTSHMPHNILSPSYNAAAQHDEALRSSLTTLLSCAAAARGLPKSDSAKRPTPPTTRSNRVDPTSFRLIPASQLPAPDTTSQQHPASSPAPSPPKLQEPTFKPTLRRTSTSTTSTSFENQNQTQQQDPSKRKARTSSRERHRSLKKARRTASNDDLLATVSPTLLTWLVSAGVVVALSALSFGAGYSMGREAGRLEGGVGEGVLGGAGNVGGGLGGCAREVVGREGLGLRRGLATSAVQV